MDLNFPKRIFLRLGQLNHSATLFVGQWYSERCLFKINTLSCSSCSNFTSFLRLKIKSFDWTECSNLKHSRSKRSVLSDFQLEFSFEVCSATIWRFFKFWFDRIFFFPFLQNFWDLDFAEQSAWLCSARAIWTLTRFVLIYPERCVPKKLRSKFMSKTFKFKMLFCSKKR